MGNRHLNGRGRRAAGERPCTTTRSLALDVQLAERVAKEARRAGMTLSTFMRSLIVDGLTRRETTGRPHLTLVAKVVNQILRQMETALVESIVATFSDAKKSTAKATATTDA